MEVAAGQVVSSEPHHQRPVCGPTRHWHFAGLHPEIREGAGLRLPGSVPDGQLRITDELIPLDVVNDLRSRVKKWREEGSRERRRSPAICCVTGSMRGAEPPAPGPSSASRKRSRRSCSSTEAPDHLKVGLEIPASGEAYTRWAVKMATGAGKTLVMGFAHRLVRPQQGGEPAGRPVHRPGPCRVPQPHRTRAAVRASTASTRAHPEVGLRGFRPDTAPVQRPDRSGEGADHELAPARTEQDPPRGWFGAGRSPIELSADGSSPTCHPTGRVLVINDEAHHAYRFPPDIKVTGEDQDEVREATVWIEA